MLYAQLTKYFEDIGDALVGIRQHYHGDADEILNIQNTTLNYPILWTETPDFTIIGDADSKQLQYKGHITVLDQTNARDKSTIQKMLKSTQEIAIKLLFQLEQDAARNNHRYSMTRTNLVAIDPSMVDSAVGWRLDYVITTYPDLSPYCEEYTPVLIN